MSGYLLAIPIKIVVRISPEKIIKRIFFIGYWPMKIRINDKLKIINEVEKFEGKTNITTNKIGNHNFIIEFLKFNFFS